MNRSQKRYTIDQYNRQRATRRLRPIPNPFNRNENTPGSTIVLNTDGTETVTQRTPGRPPIMPIGGQNAVNNANDPGPAQPGQGPIIDALRAQVNQHNERIAQEQQREMEWLDSFFNSDAGRAVLDSIASDNNVAELAQFAGEQAPHRPIQPSEASDPGEGTSNQQPEDVEMAEPNPKRPRPSGATSASPAQAVSAATSAGTGHNSGSDGGFDSAQGPESFLPSGGYKVNPGQMTFTKVHRIKSWAIPYWNYNSSTGS